MALYLAKNLDQVAMRLTNCNLLDSEVPYNTFIGLLHVKQSTTHRVDCRLKHANDNVRDDDQKS